MVKTLFHLAKKTWVRIHNEWYEIEKNRRSIHFPVILKEDNIKRILERIDEA